MKQDQCGKTGFPALKLVAACLAIVLGCGGQTTLPETIDTVRLDLNFGTRGVTLSVVGYTLTGPNSYQSTGTLAVGTADTISATFQNLPAGNGYDVKVAGNATDGTDSCAGEAMFNVQPSMNAVVTIQLVCTGLANVAANVTLCPIIDGLSVLPSAVYVGDSTTFVLAAHDNNGTARLKATWSANSGTLTNTSTTGATFTCTQPGSVQVGVTVTDGSADPTCQDSLSMTVTCTPTPSAELVTRATARKGAV
jgi:hypothetical protein